MNTRILRMMDRHVLRGYPGGVVRGLGQLQPVIFGIRKGVAHLRIEGMAERAGQQRWCRWSYPLHTCKAEAKRAFAEIEAHKAAGTRTPASKAWDEYQASRKPPVPPTPRKRIRRIAP